MKKFIFISLVSLICTPGIVSAHPGNTDSSGCHTCRTNCAKWGLSQNEYHCHRSKGVEQPKEPVKSSAKGVTVPAPEYKTPTSQVVKTKETSKEVVKATTTPQAQKSWFTNLFKIKQD